MFEVKEGYREDSVPLVRRRPTSLGLSDRSVGRNLGKYPSFPAKRMAIIQELNNSRDLSGFEDNMTTASGHLKI
jgi:hypothetical protein